MVARQKSPNPRAARSRGRGMATPGDGHCGQKATRRLASLAAAVGGLTMNRWRQRLAEINGDASVAHVVQNVQNVQNVRSLRHFEQIGQIEQPPTTLPKTLKAAVQRWINDHFVPSSPGVCA